MLMLGVVGVTSAQTTSSQTAPAAQVTSPVALVASASGTGQAASRNSSTGATAKPLASTRTAALTIRFTCASAVDHRYGKICVHTTPGAALHITVKYCTGYRAVSRSLKGTEYANRYGNYTWWWTPDTKCHGWATAYVSATSHGHTVYASDRFIVK